MHKTLFVASAVFLLAVGWLSTRWSLLPATPATARSAPGATGSVEAATRLLGTLEPAAREKTRFSYDDGERFDWHFIPRERKGLPLNEMSAAQKADLVKFLGTALSEVGVKTVEQVRDLESVLREIEGANRRFPRDPELYYLSIFGEPAAGKKWGWRFEGHHLSLNFSLHGDRVVSATPFFLGANPAIVRDGPKKGLRVLAGVEDVARELVAALDETQRKAALGEKPEEVQGTRSKTYDGDLPEGVLAATFTAGQKATLERLLKEYTKNLRPDLAGAIHEEIAAGGLKKVHFVWRGGLKPFEGHSYMVHGPTFVVSYANFQNGAAHVHAGLRDTTGEFGLK